MASKVEVCNLAISHLGTGKEIANIDTEKSEEAGACRRFYDIARDATLRDFAWPFARKKVTLALIEENPTDEWAFSYRYPADCLKAGRILSGIRNDSRQTRSSFVILKDDAGLIIYSDVDEAELEYTSRVTDPAFYPADFELAFSFRLALYIAPRITKGDPFGLRNSIRDMYNLEISTAKTSALNEVQSEENPYSEFDRSRESIYEKSRY